MAKAKKQQDWYVWSFDNGDVPDTGNAVHGSLAGAVDDVAYDISGNTTATVYRLVPVKRVRSADIVVEDI